VNAVEAWSDSTVISETRELLSAKLFVDDEVPDHVADYVYLDLRFSSHFSAAKFCGGRTVDFRLDYNWDSDTGNADEKLHFSACNTTGDTLEMLDENFDPTGCESPWGVFSDNNQTVLRVAIPRLCRSDFKRIDLNGGFDLSGWYSNKSDNSSFTLSFPGGITAEGMQGREISKSGVPGIKFPRARAYLGEKLTASPGTWDAAAKLTYRWGDFGPENSWFQSAQGAEGPIHVVTLDDLGKDLRVQVCGRKSGFRTRCEVSFWPVVADWRSLRQTPIPSLSGKGRVGSLVKASPGSWDQGTALSVSWLRNGKVISGSTKLNYKVLAADVGACLSVRIKGTKSGFRAISKTSKTLCVIK
jgi:hypothetical protein